MKVSLIHVRVLKGILEICVTKCLDPVVVDPGMAINAQPFHNIMKYTVFQPVFWF